MLNLPHGILFIPSYCLERCNSCVYLVKDTALLPLWQTSIVCVLSSMRWTYVVTTLPSLTTMIEKMQYRNNQFIYTFLPWTVHPLAILIYELLSYHLSNLSIILCANNATPVILYDQERLNQFDILFLAHVIDYWLWNFKLFNLATFKCFCLKLKSCVLQELMLNIAVNDML